MFRIFVCVHSNTPILQNQELLICRFGNRRKKEKIIPPICSVVAVFKMLIRILNTLPSRIWDVLFFSFFWLSKSTVEQRGMYQMDMIFREIKA